VITRIIIIIIIIIITRIRSEPSVAARHRATEDHTNKPSTNYSLSVGLNRFDLLLRSGITNRHLVAHRPE